ncbi:integrase catalytic domain-containing protein [Trichonephila inaurata madagascariensis]|uniref:Integrase catalytic domain-containing protein n=1 Tax=Trichonephila inaurata madagascariensis TaxID=2747483 RepID=A0A8X6WS71_9ARAC|nr:integrase catalytic domain-containing protein [Trichonephila inaurata madagascariensis]
MLNTSLYVDDLFAGSSESVNKAFDPSKNAIEILKDANMNLRKFKTNSKELRKLWNENGIGDVELVNNLTTETFLLALRRFIRRRRLCSKILTDNARTFKRSEIELKNLWKVISDPTVKAFYASHKIYWQFIIERAPWWGGFYERLIRTVKLALRKTVGRTTLFRDVCVCEIKEFKIDDVVLINDEKIPRHFWKLGKVVDVFPGRDGKIRSCKIKTQNSVIKRSVQLLHNLELNE